MPQHAQLYMHVHCPSKALAAHTKNSVDTPWGMGTLAHATMFFAAIGPSLSSNGGTPDTMPIASPMHWLGNFPIEKKRCPPPTLPACRLQCTFAPRIFCPPLSTHIFCIARGKWLCRHARWGQRPSAGRAGGLPRRRGMGRPGLGPAQRAWAGRRPGPAQGAWAGRRPAPVHSGRPKAWSGQRPVQGLHRCKCCRAKANFASNTDGHPPPPSQ